MQQRETLSSRLGFILLSAGCAVGLGNVWRFPYITGRYGGATFVLIYLVFLAVFGLPVMVMEFAIGRASRTNIGGALKALEPEGTKWHLYSPFAVAGNYLLMMYYTTITGWLMYYFWKYLTGGFNGVEGDQIAASFGALTANAPLQVFWMAVTVILGFLVVSFGLKSGVEGVTKKMMVALFVLIVILAVHSIMLPGGGEGLAFYLKPSMKPLEEHGFDVVFAAMSQAFFTLSLGIGAMEIFGSYIDRSRSLTGESVHIIVLDTFVAFTAGLIIFPACSAYGVDAGAGPTLLFISMPHIFSAMKGGRFWGALFFLFMSFAAMSTVIAVFENITSYWIDTKHVSRRKACLWNTIAVFLLSLPCLLGFNVLSGFQPFGPGSGVLDAEDFIVSNTLLPLGSLLFCLFCTRRYGWGWEKFKAEADLGEGLKFPTWMRWWCRWCLPVLFLVVFVRGYMDILLG